MSDVWYVSDTDHSVYFTSSTTVVWPNLSGVVVTECDYMIGRLNRWLLDQPAAKPPRLPHAPFYPKDDRNPLVGWDHARA